MVEQHGGSYNFAYFRPPLITFFLKINKPSYKLRNLKFNDIDDNLFGVGHQQQMMINNIVGTQLLVIKYSNL